MIFVAHLNPTKTWRGGEQQTFYLSRYLKEKISQIVIVNPFSELHNRCLEENIPVIPFKIRGELDLISAYQITKYIIQNQVQILHAHTAKAHGIGILIKKICNLKNHNIKLIVSRRVDFARKQNFLSKLKYQSQTVDAFIAISQNVKNILIKDGVELEKIHVIYSGIDLSRFKKTLPEETVRKLKKEFQLENKIVLGNIAALVDHKDQKTLLYAAHKLVLKKIENWKLLIVGEGELKKDLMKLSQQLKLNQNVVFTGFRKDAFDILKILDIFVMSSKEEGLGTSILDAMACGLPIVSTAGGGIPEIVIENQGGLLSPVQEPSSLAYNLEKLIQDHELRKKMGTFNKKIVKNFSYQETGKKTLKLYKTFINFH